MLEDALETKAVVRLPLATSNRHGLIAGATGTGKTRTLQLLAGAALRSRQGKALQREIVRGMFGMLRKRL